MNDDEYRRWQDRIFQEMEDRAKRARALETQKIHAACLATKAYPFDPLLRQRLLALGADNEWIMSLRVFFLADRPMTADTIAAADAAIANELDSEDTWMTQAFFEEKL